MQYSVVLASLLAGADAFPHMARQMMEQVEKRALETRQDGSLSYTGLPTTVFNAQDQYVANDGAYYYKAADFSAGDIRGPCPGLNAAANHGYIARNGVTNLLEAIQGTNAVFNMGTDLGGFLSAYSVLQDGDPLTLKWSIGGIADLGGILPLQGSGTGLSGSHNKYETDSSPMRGDLYQYGNNYELQLNQFQEFYDYHKGEENPNYTFDDLVKFRTARFTESIEQNPEFFYGPFTGILVSQAAFTFISAFMSNHSAEYPNGFLSRDVLKSFMGITETGGTGVGDGTLAFNPGTERIPDNWYRRASVNPYSIPEFLIDVLRVAESDPRILDVGGNTGTVNSFAGVSLSDLTGGVYNLQNLATGNNALCFGKQFAELLTPDFTLGVTATVKSAVSALVSKYIDAPITGCPQLSAIDTSNLQEYPGFVKSQTESTGFLKRSELYSDANLAKRAERYAAKQE